MTAPLSAIRHLVLDLDGTIYRGSTLFPFTLPFLARLDRLGLGYTFLTNNTSLGRRDYLEKLARLGIAASSGQLITSADATIHHLLHSLPELRRLALLGTPSLAADFLAAGFEIDWESPQAVVAAFDTGLTYERLCRAAWWISQGLPFLATHPDLVCPTDRPTVLVDCGSICAALQAATGRAPLVFGKPLPAVLDPVFHRQRLAPHQVAVVGDRLMTDVALARNAGAVSILVLTGEATREQALASASPPDHVIDDLEELGLQLPAL